MKQILHAKIHRATVTQAEPDYIGSITIDSELMEKTGILENERVLIADINNGNRLETYAIAGEKGSGVICLNGAAANLVKVGDTVIIMAFELTDEPISPKVILVDENNKFTEYLS